MCKSKWDFNRVSLLFNFQRQFILCSHILFWKFRYFFDHILMDNSRCHSFFFLLYVRASRRILFVSVKKKIKDKNVRNWNNRLAHHVRIFFVCSLHQPGQRKPNEQKIKKEKKGNKHRNGECLDMCVEHQHQSGQRQKKIWTEHHVRHLHWTTI